MIDEFVQVAYERDTERDHIAKLAKSMESLPAYELKKIARFGLSMGGDEKGWLDKYKGTPMFDQAVALEQQSLQMEMQRVQSDQERQLKWQADDQMRAAEDQLCIQKRMLDLELASQENVQTAIDWELASQENVQAAGEAAAMMGGAAAPPEVSGPPSPEAAAAMGAGPPPEAGPPMGGPPMEAGPPAGMPPEAMKMAAMRFAEASGRMLVRADMEKEALGFGAAAKGIMRAYKSRGVGAAASRAGKIGKGYGQRALGWAKKNPGTAVGLGVGAGAVGAGGLALGARQ